LADEGTNYRLEGGFSKDYWQNCYGGKNETLVSAKHVDHHRGSIDHGLFSASDHSGSSAHHRPRRDDRADRSGSCARGDHSGDSARRDDGADYSRTGGDQRCDDRGNRRRYYGRRAGDRRDVCPRQLWQL
jgi:hypothetical protein